ncbi:MAG: low molecular weight phosphatase family protein [Pseudolabrys sp.]|nr:low molecular weight phosphatase family protein [Pseudolabrys sp.]MBV9956107.1 low molecular weight phosphatase family protein [Pseudolabrys sp.]
MAAARPKAVLFACSMNAVRSPMAAALMQQMFGKAIPATSAGVHKGELDPFAVVVMDELGIDMKRHRPMSFEELQEFEGIEADLVVTLSPDAHHKAMTLTHTLPIAVEYWPTPDPTVEEGNREQRLESYRAVRDQLLAKIRSRFGPHARGNE